MEAAPLPPAGAFVERTAAPDRTTKWRHRGSAKKERDKSIEIVRELHKTNYPIKNMAGAQLSLIYSRGRCVEDGCVPRTK